MVCFWVNFTFTAERIFMKFCEGGVLLKLVDDFRFWLECNNGSFYFTGRLRAFLCACRAQLAKYLAETEMFLT